VKLLIEIDLTLISGKAQTPEAMAAHIIENLISRGELDGHIWVGATRTSDGSRYAINAAFPRTGRES
jgi:hypothetical protein